MIKVRKFFNFLDKKREYLLMKQHDELFKASFDAAKIEMNKYTQGVYRYNNTCPKCKSTKIVDRIAGYVKDYWWSDHSKSVTVSHCSDCGQDWERMEEPYVETDRYLKFWLQELIKGNDPVECPIRRSDIYAETFIYIEKLMYEFDLGTSLKKLRKDFKSIYDETNLEL